jgi:transposase-like protein
MHDGPSLAYPLLLTRFSTTSRDTNALRVWVHQAKVDAGAGKPGELTTAEREELSRLRREVKTLRLEREILKKAAAFFAKENG